jgi:pyruvate/2-oxoglutarate dehydrogenase complex dihydrolipoamide acyltransferase (E2) component
MAAAGGPPTGVTTAGVDVVMPQMGVSVSEGTVVEWRKQVGDEVERDEVICSISTDKIDTDVEAPAAGTLTEILVDVGTTVDVGTVLAVIGGEGGTARAGAPEPETAAAAPAHASESAPAPAPPAAPRSPGGRHYSPVVRRIAAEHGIDLEAVEGTGRGGRVRKQDVLAAVEGNGASAPAAAAEPAPAEAPMHIESPYRPEDAAPAPARARASRWVRKEDAVAPAAGRLSRMRKSIGEHMLHSLRTAATCTSVIEVDMSRVEADRARLGITALPLIAQATVAALREFPALNATLEGDDYTRHRAVHLGIAVSLGEEGLIVPVVRDAQQLSAEGLSERIRDLARRARAKQLTPDDVRGGTFTITNPGQFGTIMATPVINQPQVAILDTEATVKRPVVVTDADGNDAIAIRPMAYFCLSWDHRALDGVEAARFLAAVKERVQRPA